MKLDKETVVKKMGERGFVVYSQNGSSIVHFVSKHMYELAYKEPVKKTQYPVINIIVDIENDKFQCLYQLEKSLTQLKTPKCGSVMNDAHFDRIVGQFETEAKWMARLTS